MRRYFNNTNYDPFLVENVIGVIARVNESRWNMYYFDIGSLKSLIGGDKTFIQRLDYMYGLHGKDLVNVGNEPSFLGTYLYIYVG